MTRDYNKCPRRCKVDCWANMNGGECKAPFMASSVKEEPVKPSDIPIPTKEQLRKAGESMTDRQKEDWVKEHSVAAAKILLTLFHTTQLETHIDTTVESEGEYFRLRFEKQFLKPEESQEELTVAVFKNKWTGEISIYPEPVKDDDHFNKIVALKGRKNYEITKSSFTITRK